MGAQPTRITAEDFLTPPELAAWRLAANPAGRIGGVRAELVAGDTVTRLGGCYQQVPLRVLPPFHFGPGRPALLYLLNPTAGLMDGDGQLVELTARAGTRAVVVGQSATRIHPCLHGYATQQWRLRVEAGAVLAVLPGPAIPFQGCRYYQRVDVDLAPGANFLWGDVWLPGRYARGSESEQFRFDRMVQELSIRRGGRLVFRDRFCWQGPWNDAEAHWHFGGATACGSLFASGPVSEALPPGPESLAEAVSPTAFGDTCFRWCGPSEAVIARVVRTALSVAATRAGGRAGAAWLPDGDLAPAHWFSPGCDPAHRPSPQPPS
jgi:urease accessory protein